ncbi:MAG: NifU family protein [Bacteroidota bacterium]
MVKRQVVLHVEGVPNPNAIKIVLENGILADTPYEFSSFGEAKNSPLARKLMMLRYVERVMINFNYVTIVKSRLNSPAWDDILFELKMLIQQHLEQDEPIMYVGTTALHHKRTQEEVLEVVENILDKHIRPAAQVDGGDILVDSYDKGVLNLTMHGACHLCPYAVQTLKQGVEPVLMQMVPEIKRVTAIANNVS